MPMSSRKRGKLNKRIGKAIQQRTRAIVTANEKAMTKDDLSSVPFGPKASRGGSGRDRLKLGSYGVGFQGPRGFGSPTDKVGKAEADGGKLASITKVTPSRERPRPTDSRHPGGHLAGSKRFAGDTAWAGEAMGYDYSAPVPYEPVKRRKGKGRWKTLDLNDK